jgi:membrane-associated phospholipid phosphatase
MSPLPTLARLALAGSIALAASPARAAPDQRMPLRENFSGLETTLAVGAAASGIFLVTLGGKVFDSPAPSLGPPDPGSLDARLSRRLYAADGEDRRFLWRIPDYTGYVFPMLPLAAYGASTLSLALRDQPLWPGLDANPHHRLVAYAEALGWTYVITGVVKYTVGRPRPYTEGSNDHPELRSSRAEDNLSFFSGHASGTFAAGAFLAEDVSRLLLRGPLATEGPAARFLLGTLLPYALGYGIPAVVSLSRMVDQQHWPSDVALGALTGVLVSHLTYGSHFDAEGRPRRRRGPVTGAVVPLVERRPDGGGGVSVAYVARF